MNPSTARPNPGATGSNATWRAHGSFAVCLVVCLIAFAWMISFGTFRLIADDSFGTFYDHQAAAWLDGRWDVPEPSLSSEAFVVDGRVYGYFGPTPALLRLPLVILGVGFGQVTRLLMLFDYAACLTAVYVLLWQAARWRNPQAIPSTFSSVLLTVTAGLGTTLFFVGSRAYVYHEAILCGAAFALWSVVFSLRYLDAGKARAWLPALACGVLAVHARAPIGLFALSLLAAVGVARAVRTWKASPAQAALRPLIVAGLGLLGIASFYAVSFLKFGTLEGCPLHLNVQYTPDQLAVVGHRNFHFSNLRFNTDSYLLRPTFSVSQRFPYIYREFSNRRDYPESRLIYRDPTLAIPWSMPGLFAQAGIGSTLAAAVVPALRLPVATLWAAALPAMLAMLTAISVTQRYTADFCPFLLAAAAFGVAGTEAFSGRVRGLWQGVQAVLVALGVLVTVALTIHHQREIVWGVPEEARQEYQRWRGEGPPPLARHDDE